MDDSIRKVVYLAINDTSKKMEYADPELAMSRFIIEFGDRLSGHLNTMAVTENYGQAPQ